MFISHRFYETVGTRHAINASLSPSKPFRPQFVKEQSYLILTLRPVDVKQLRKYKTPLKALSIKGSEALGLG